MFEEDAEQIEQLVSALISCPESFRPILAEGISRIQRNPKLTFDVYTKKEVIKTSIDTLVTTYFFYALYYEWGEGNECDKYLMFQCIFDYTFSEVEIESLRKKFQKFAILFLKPNFLKGVQEINKSYTAPRDKSQTMPHNLPTPPKWGDYLQFFVIFAGLMTNYLDICLTRKIERPNYIPFYVRRYEKAKQPDGFWETAFAPVNSLCYFKTLEVNINAKALNEAGFSTDQWVGVIVHEILHNGGWEHPNGYEDTSQFLIAVENLAVRLANAIVDPI
jgi:hypothetical protein